jgi:hypothetical protein
MTGGSRKAPPAAPAPRPTRDPLLDKLDQMKKSLEGGRVLFVMAPPSAARAAPVPRNAQGSADRRSSVYHEAGHAVAHFGLDRLLHLWGQPLRQSVTDLEIHPRERADGLIASIGAIHRRRDRTWNRDFVAGDPAIPGLLRDAMFEAIEGAAGTFAEAREAKGGWEAARSSALVRGFRERVLAGTAPEAHDEAQLGARLSFIRRHAGRTSADVLDDIEAATWALLAFEWTGLAAVARALDHRGFLDGHTAMGIWATARLPPDQREAEAEAASPAGIRVMEDLLETLNHNPPRDGSS